MRSEWIDFPLDWIISWNFNTKPEPHGPNALSTIRPSYTQNPPQCNLWVLASSRQHLFPPIQLAHENAHQPPRWRAGHECCAKWRGIKNDTHFLWWDNDAFVCYYSLAMVSGAVRNRWLIYIARTMSVESTQFNYVSTSIGTVQFKLARRLSSSDLHIRSSLHLKHFGRDIRWISVSYSDPPIENQK